jgi:chitodextrinase
MHGAVGKLSVLLIITLSACGPDLELPDPTAGGGDASAPRDASAAQDGGRPDAALTPDTGLVSRPDGGSADASKADTGPGADQTPPVFGGVSSVVAKSETDLEVSWLAAKDDRTPPSGVAYLVFVSPSSPVSTATPKTTVTGLTAARISGLTPGTKYHALVRARDEAGNVDPNTREIFASTLDTTAPTTPTGVVASGTGAGELLVTWTASTDNGATSADLNYLVAFSTAAGGTATAPPRPTTLGVTSMKISGLSPSTPYFVAVRAQDLAGNLSPYSAEVSASTKADTSAPVFAGATSAVAIGPDAIRVNWNPASDDASDTSKIVYGVYQGPSSGAVDFTTPVVTATGAITAVVNGLSQATTYFFVVRAKDESGNADKNVREQSTRTQADVTPPTFLGVATVSVKSDSALEVSWSAASDNVSKAPDIAYNLYVAKATKGQDFLVPTATSAKGATTHTLSGLSPSTQYFVVVRAKDQAGVEEKNTVEKSATTSAAPDTTPPTFTGIGTLVAKSTTSLEATWTAASDAVTTAASLTYNVYVATSAGQQAFGTPTVFVTGALSATLSGLNPSATYHVVARARDLAGNEDKNTVEKSAATLTPPDVVPPTFAGLVSATTKSQTEVDLAWTAGSDDRTAASNLVYRVFAATASGGHDFAVATAKSPKGATSFTVTGLSPGTKYHFVVRAEDEAGNTDSNKLEKSATTTSAPDTTAPTFAGVATAVAKSATEVEVTWTAATDNVSTSAAILYNVYMATATGAQSFAAPKVATLAGATSATVTGLTQGTQYFFVVRAKDEAGNEETNKVEKAATTPTPDTTAPVFSGVATAMAKSSTEITLTWIAASDDQSAASKLVYNVYSATASGAQSFTTPKLTTAAGATTAAVTGLTAGTRYFFVVRAKDEAGNEDKNVAEKDATTTAAATVSFASAVQTVFNNQCTCHTLGSSGQLSLASGQAYNNLVNVASSCDPTKKRVVPSDTANSLLWLKLSNDPSRCGGSMPQGFPGGLKAKDLTDFTTVEKWIQEGAQNN